MGVNYVEKITNDGGHIFRRALDEDVGYYDSTAASIFLAPNFNYNP